MSYVEIVSGAASTRWQAGPFPDEATALGWATANMFDAATEAAEPTLDVGLIGVFPEAVGARPITDYELSVADPSTVNTLGGGS